MNTTEMHNLTDRLLHEFKLTREHGHADYLTLGEGALGRPMSSLE